jgi:hypothetical protein
MVFMYSIEHALSFVKGTDFKFIIFPLLTRFLLRLFAVKIRNLTTSSKFLISVSHMYELLILLQVMIVM